MAAAHSRYFSRVLLGFCLCAAALAGCDRDQSVGLARAGQPSASSTPVAPASAPSSAASSATAPQAATGQLRELTWTFDNVAPYGRIRVVVAIPTHASEQNRLPVLVAMHGRGEALKGPDVGARGWIDDYWLPKAVRRLHNPPLARKDLLDIADNARLQRINHSLEQAAYGGVIVVCPYTPDISVGNQAFSAAKPLEHFLVDVLLPRVYKETPAIGTAQTTGIDGVSLGGRAALLVGLSRPESFGAVGGIQPAFGDGEIDELTGLATSALKANPSLSIRLLTSSHDFYRNTTRATSQTWKVRGLAHSLVVVPGPHNYAFNRGPGVVEMLLFHDRALRGKPADWN